MSALRGSALRGSDILCEMTTVFRVVLDSMIIVLLIFVFGGNYRLQQHSMSQKFMNRIYKFLKFVKCNLLLLFESKSLYQILIFTQFVRVIFLLGWQ